MSSSPQAAPRHIGRFAFLTLAAVTACGWVAQGEDKEKPGAAKPPSAREDGPRRPDRKRPAAPLKDLRLKDDDPPAEEQIERTLGQPTDVNFVEVSLEDVLGYLREQHKVPVWIDRAALAEADVELDRPVSLQLSGVRFESVLNLLLEPLKLEWLIQDEVLKVTTKRRAAALAETRVFDVQHLLDAGHEPDDLIDSIRSCIEPDSWAGESNDGTGDISHSGGTLICRQTQRVQSAIINLLMDLDDIAERQLDESSHPRGEGAITLKVYRTGDFPADELSKALLGLLPKELLEVKGTELRAIRGALLVRHTPRCHREIRKVIDELLAVEGPHEADDHEARVGLRGMPGGSLPKFASRRGR